jgi:membrane protein DedA with SNARE-associated domain
MESFIQEWGYIALFLYSFGGGMLAIAIAGVFSFTGDLNIVTVMIVAATSNFLGDTFLFYLARTNKNYAREMMTKHKRKIALSHLMMRKYGSWVIFIQKYLYGIKTLIPLAMGLTKYDMKRFTIYNLMASIIWAVIVGGLAYVLGQVFLDSMEEYKYYGVVIILLLLLVIFNFLRKY